MSESINFEFDGIDNNLLFKDARSIKSDELDKLIVSAIHMDGKWIPVSYYRENVWRLTEFTKNSGQYLALIDFNGIKETFRPAIKAIIYRYLKRGIPGSIVPKSATVRKMFVDMKSFLNSLEKFKVSYLKDITPLICTNYVAECKAKKRKDKPLSNGRLHNLFHAVELIYELSQFTTDVMQQHPWPDTTSRSLAGMNGFSGPYTSKTPLIPDEIFCKAFESSYKLLEQGTEILDLRDKLFELDKTMNKFSRRHIAYLKNKVLLENGWNTGLREYWKQHDFLRTACYIVLASTSGCRNHEMANLQSGAHHKTEDDQGTIFHWMRSISEKTGKGIHDWMIPEVGVRALRMMERWSQPFQNNISLIIAKLRIENPENPKIVENQRHLHSLFLNALTGNKGNYRTLSNTQWSLLFKKYSDYIGLGWILNSHQFRRKFATYAAQSEFGDLRYLREHYAHWSMDMTLAYAIDNKWRLHLDLDLYNEVQDEHQLLKISTVNQWINADKLGGGYGRSLKAWQRDPKNLAIFKDHAHMIKSVSSSTSIRSNGHSWCTADDDKCIGNSMERTRCGDCNNAVIGNIHVKVYQGWYNNLNELLDDTSISDSGRHRIVRDKNRCREVLVNLGYDPEPS